MPRRQSTPHIDDRIAAEMARLEAQADRLRHMDELLEIRQLENVSHVISGSPLRGFNRQGPTRVHICTAGMLSAAPPRAPGAPPTIPLTDFAYLNEKSRVRGARG